MISVAARIKPVTSVWRVFGFRVAVISLFTGIAHASGDALDFVQDVQPILVEHCTRCHGGVKKRAGLSFTSERGAFAKAKSGSVAIVAGRPEQSELIKRIRTQDLDDRMPPEGDPLSADQSAILAQWIKNGARWEKHWSFRPAIKVDEPRVADSKWGSNPIDSFVLKKLEAEGVSPSPEANRSTLIRRLYLDILGLLPPVTEVDAFVMDRSPEAYEQLVDRLLASPRFGERWGRHWLDQARYADSDGYEKDNARPNAWRYRDWVIQAFNNDMPYDEFSLRQLAGDLQVNASPEDQLATAFHRQTLFNREGGVDQEEDRVKRLVDRVNTTSAIWLGLTVGCTQCHDHPYDALSQKEYYQLFAFFNDSDEKNVSVHRSSDDDEVVLRTAFDKACVEQLSAFAAWQQQIRDADAASGGADIPLTLNGLSMSSGSTFEDRKDGSWFSASKADQETYSFKVENTIEGVIGFRLEVLSDKRLPANGPGWVKHGNFVLNEFEAKQHADLLSFQSAKADYSQSGWPDRGVIDGDEKTGWAVSPQFGRDHAIDLFLVKPIDISSTRPVEIKLKQHYGSRHIIGRFRLLAITGNGETRSLPQAVREDVASDLARDHYFQRVNQHTRKIHDQWAALKKDQQLNVRVLNPKAGGRETFVFHRGDFLQPRKNEGAVSPGTHAVLPALTVDGTKRTNRKDLATWLMSDEHPLTARVRANKVWAHLFGVGLVSTPDDFGVRGVLPSHAELLDWLAVDFREQGWSLKTLIKTIVSSSTYRQSAVHRPELIDRDPGNAWLAHQNRVRVEAEIVRDIYLDAAGLLSKKVGGPSVFPPLPAEVSKQSYANNFKWKTSTGEDRYRRGMYTFFKRTAPDPNLITFDCPDANVSNAQRGRSNTPIQALATLHNEVFVEAAQAFMQRVLAESATDGDRERLIYAWKVALSRTPEKREVDALLSLLEGSRAYYRAHADGAKQLVGSHTRKGGDIVEQAAWIATLRMVLNLDEFINRG